MGAEAAVSTAAAVVSAAVAQVQCRPLVRSAEDWWIFVDALNFLAIFGYYLASFLASVYLLVSQKRQIFGLLFVLQI